MVLNGHTVKRKKCYGTFTLLRVFPNSFTKMLLETPSNEKFFAKAMCFFYGGSPKNLFWHLYYQEGTVRSVLYLRCTSNIRLAKF